MAAVDSKRGDRIPVLFGTLTFTRRCAMMSRYLSIFKGDFGMDSENAARCKPNRKAEAAQGLRAPQAPDKNRQLLRNIRGLGRTIRALSEGRASQKRILRLIEESGCITQHALTGRLGVQPGSVSEVIGKLETAGLILRTPNPDDRRTSDIRLTPQGLAQAQLAAQQAQARRQEMFSCLSEEEKDVLLRLLEKLNADWKHRYHADAPGEGPEAPGEGRRGAE